MFLVGEGVDSLLGASPLEVATAAMDLKERRHRSLTRNRCAKELQFTTSTLDVPTQKSYSSSETLKAFEHEARLPYGGCVTDLVHHEADEYSRQGMGKFIFVLLCVHMHQHTCTLGVKCNATIFICICGHGLIFFCFLVFFPQ